MVSRLFVRDLSESAGGIVAQVDSAERFRPPVISIEHIILVKKKNNVNIKPIKCQVLVIISEMLIRFTREPSKHRDTETHPACILLFYGL